MNERKYNIIRANIQDAPLVHLVKTEEYLLKFRCQRGTWYAFLVVLINYFACRAKWLILWEVREKGRVKKGISDR